MNLKKLSALIKDRKKQNFFIYGLGHAFNLLSPLVIIPYIVALFGEDGFAKVSLGFTMALFLMLVIDYAFDVKGTKQASENRDNKRKLEELLSFTVFTKSVIFIPVAVVVIAGLYTIPFFAEERMVFLLSLVLVFSQVFNPIWFLQGIEQFTIASVLNIGSKTLYLVLVYTLVKGGNDYIYVNFFLGISALLFNVGTLIYIKFKYKFTAVKPDFKEVGAVLKADFSFCASQLFLSVRQLSPVWLITYFSGYYVAGQYKIIEQIITLFRTAIQVFLRYFYPSVCYKIAESVKQGFAFWKKYSVFGFIMVAASLSVIFVFSDEVLMFFNVSEETIITLGTTFRIALLIPLLMAVSLPLEQLMFIADKHTAYIRTTMTVTAVNVLAIVAVLTSGYGIPGIILSLIVAELLFILLYFKNSYLHLSHKTQQ